MPAETANDFRNLMDGSDFTTVVYTGANVELFGILDTNPAESLDYHGTGLDLMLVNEDAARVSIGATLKVNDTTYTVREKRPGERATHCRLEVGP